MSKHRSSTRSARVDAILRYRSASEGVLCSTRCRELSRTGLTASIERPVFPGELLRFDLEPPTGGPSVLGLARVAWTGGDPEGAPGALLMRMRFISLGEASENALLEWLEEISDITERRSSPQDDSSVRALSRAIADSLLPPPPVLPGAVPSTESSGLSPSPVTVPNRRSIPPPPGMYTRSTRTLSHPVDHVGAIKAARVPVAPAPAPEAAASKSRALRGAAPASRRTADVRERLSRLQSRRDNTPLVVYTQTAELDAAVRAEPVSSSPSPASPSSSPFARVSLAPPLPLGALLNAPPETTRRSSPPPPGQQSSASSSSWPALRVPASVAAVALPELDASPPPATQRVSRATIPPPAQIEEMPPLRVSQPPIEPVERASLPIEGPSLPLSDAPWSVPAPPPRARRVRPWVALCVGSVAVGAAIAYLVYAPALRESRSSASIGAAIRPPAQNAPAAAAAPSTAPAAPDPAAAAQLDADESLKHWIGLPKERGIDELDVGEAPPAAPAPAARLAPPPAPGAPIEPTPPIAAIKPAPAAVPPPAPLVAAGSTAAPPPPPPALPSVLASPLEQARACIARGDSACALALLKNATSEPEVALWIETLRAAGRAPEARAAMERYIQTFPDAHRATTYRRILNNAP